MIGVFALPWQALCLIAIPAIAYWMYYFAKHLHRTRRLKLWEKREAAGLCFICGYDLRGSPERCPECGIESIKLYGERLHREIVTQ